jgi:hypothetical protein
MFCRMSQNKPASLNTKLSLRLFTRSGSATKQRQVLSSQITLSRSLWPPSHPSSRGYVIFLQTVDIMLISTIRLNFASRNGQPVCWSRPPSTRKLRRTNSKLTSKISQSGTMVILLLSVRFAISSSSVPCMLSLFRTSNFPILTHHYSHSAGASTLETKSRVSNDAKRRAQEELEGRTGDTDSEVEESSSE